MAPDGLRPWGLTLARLYMGASAIALVYLVRAFPDFPLELHGLLGRVVFLATPAVATFGALWRAPSRWVVFSGPVLVLGAAAGLAVLALQAPGLVAGLPRPDGGLLAQRLVPLLLVSLPGALLGTAGAAASLER